MQLHEILQFFYTNKENKRKNRLIKNKVQIKNANMRIIKWLQQFITNFIQQVVSLLLVGNVGKIMFVSHTKHT